MRLQEMRTQAQELANKITAMAKGRKERTEARSKDASAPEPWTEAHAAEWADLNQRYDALLAELEQAQQEADFAARAAEVDDQMQRRAADWNRRPDGDELPPGQEGNEHRTTYGELGMTREEARAYEQRQHDAALNFRAWATQQNPYCEPLIAEKRFADARQRTQFNPAAGSLQLAHLETLTLQGLQRRLNAVHPERREQIIFEFIAGSGREARAMTAGQGSAGGFLTIPATVVRAVEVAMIRYGAVLSVADTITTETGENMPWPIADDTSNEGAYNDEAQDHDSDVNPSFEAVTWGAWDLNSKFIKVSYRLQRDSFPDLEQLIGNLIGERLGRKVSSEATVGTQRIQGFVPRSPVGHTAAGATAITYADVVGLDHSVDPDHRANLSYQFHDVVLEQLRLLLDSQNRPLWISNIAAGAPDTFNGHRYTINQKMASSIASAAKTMAAGDMSKIKVRRVKPALRLVRLNERFAEKGLTAFIGYTSVDANVLRPNTDAAAPIQILQQA